MTHNEVKYMKWQPIETAPKDGTVIILSKYGKVYAGWFNEDDDVEWHFIDDTQFILTGCCDKEKKDLIEPNGWLTTPKIWMPLPEAPKP